LPDELVSQLHKPGLSNVTEIEYRLAWARTYLKKAELINNSIRGVWSFSKEYRYGQPIEPNQIIRSIRNTFRTQETIVSNDYISPLSEVLSHSDDDDNVDIDDQWRILLHQALLKMSADAFERLTQRLLRESGFVQVEVTGRTGDGGIDGKGILRLQNVISYHVVFQCKRYRGSVGSSDIKDFRGAMVGRADKGIFITTGSFTRDAIIEATRDGAPAIDLIDGDSLAGDG
jgi:restriction system protein